MSFFDLSHVTDVPVEGSAGPPVTFTEMLTQSFRQQFRVDSARAIDNELRNRWLESLRLANISTGPGNDPYGNIELYRRFAQHVSGQPVTTNDWGLFGKQDPLDPIREMIGANEDIKALNDPKIKSFEQIFEEVAQMQKEVEEKTGSMYERTGTGGFVASLLGAMAGSFTTRDPLNLITAPIGVGRTVVTRIASDMALAAGITGYTELAEVAPARQIAGLPERDPIFNIGAATLGAGVIRGGIEGIGYGIGRLRAREDINFDARDTQLMQTFVENSDKPSARAGAMILDDATYIERNNPFGESRAAQERFIAELTEIQKAMNGAPMTAVGRVLPPLPFEYIKKAADFEIVREQAPDVWAKMEAAQVRVQELQARINGTQVEDAEWRVDTTPEGDNVWRQPYGTKTPEGAIQSGNFSNAIDWIKSNSTNESNQALAERLATLVDGVELRVFNSEEARLGQVPPRMARVHGSVLHSRGQARAFLNADTRGLDEEVILHEAIHAAVAIRIGTLRNLPQKQINQAEGYGKDARRLQVISKQARKAYYERAAKNELEDMSFLTRSEMQIAFDNTDEFLTYGLTNPEFQKFLDSVKSPAVDAEIKGLTLWQAFVDLLRGIIGLPKKYEAEFDRILREGTLNEQFFDTADDLFDRMDRTLPVKQTREGGDEAVAGGYSLYAKRTDETKELRQLLRKANKEYQAAYREVEAEAARLNTLATKAQDAQQTEASNILAQAYGRPFIGPLLRHENVESVVERINKVNETLDEDTIALFVRQAEADTSTAQPKLKVFHGTASAFDKFSLDYTGKVSGGNEKAVWFTTDTELASAYAKVASPGGWRGSNVRFEEIDPEDFLRVDMEGKKFNALEIRPFFEQAATEGKKGVIFDNFDDSIGGVSRTSTVVGVTDLTALDKELAWNTPKGIDIGLRDPVDPEFRFVTDEGEMTVAAAMRDLQDDTDLVEAIRVCSI